ncbi:MAG: 16S rRNA (guanine(966)-N(2))-methyltransferase RsmD [Desulfovibrionaceae bacterium]
MRIISGIFRGRVLKTAEGPGYRPAMSRVRESLFSMLESRGVIWNQCTVLDLFAGTGSLAFEAVSRGAIAITHVESAPKAAACLRESATMLGLDEGRCRIVAEEVAKVLSKGPHHPFDVVFIDPPYGKKLLEPTLRQLLRKAWVKVDGIVSAEVEARAVFDAEHIHAELELLADRVFGQTRIVVWKKLPIE